MKIAPVIVALVIAAALGASAQTPDTKPKPAPAKPADGSVEQTLMKIERDALAALLKKDIAAFGRIFADDAVIDYARWFAANEGTVARRREVGRPGDRVFRDL